MRAGFPPLRPGDVLWSELLGPDALFAAAVGDPDRVTNVLFSSGTTGTPKAIPWSQVTPLKCAMDGHFHQDIRRGDVVAWPTNIGWMMGPWLMYASLLNDAAMALYEGGPGGFGFTHFVEDARETMLGLVPSLVRAWRSTGATNRADWSRVRAFSSTGGPSNREDYLWLMSRNQYRAPVMEYLGGTETLEVPRRQEKALEPLFSQEFGIASIVGNSGAMQKVFAKVRRAAPSDSTVLITGESGTGKELVARAIHRHSLRADQAFVPVDCSALVESCWKASCLAMSKARSPAPIRPSTVCLNWPITAHSSSMKSPTLVSTFRRSCYA